MAGPLERQPIRETPRETNLAHVYPSLLSERLAQAQIAYQERLSDLEEQGVTAAVRKGLLARFQETMQQLVQEHHLALERDSNFEHRDWTGSIPNLTAEEITPARRLQKKSVSKFKARSPRSALVDPHRMPAPMRIPKC